MRSFLTLGLLVASIAASPSPRDKQQSQPQEQNSHNQNVPCPTNPVSPVAVTVNQSPAPQQKETSRAQSHDWHEWFWPPIWSNWALIVVAAIAAYAAFGNLEEIRRQSQATENAANAALLNAQSAKRSTDLLVSSERPWIIANVRTNRIFGNVFTFALINCGRTPAYIVSARTYDIFVQKGETFPTQPNRPPRTDWSDFGIVAPKESADRGAELDTIRFEESTEDDSLAVRMGTEILLRYIETVYKNTLEDSMIHETKMAYRYDFLLREFQRQHIKGYSKYT